MPQADRRLVAAGCRPAGRVHFALPRQAERLTDLRTQLQTALAASYTLERELGRGGMATVFLAQDLRHDRPVALKVLHPDSAHALGPERFQREIKLAARLQHPHILTVHDSGEAAGQLWFTMPFVEGESLRDRLRRERQLPVDEALRIATEAARALEYAHRHGVIHRDIKPENLLLTADGSTLVADFGIARALAGADERLTETGLAVGTPAYMSPEQAAGDKGARRAHRRLLARLRAVRDAGRRAALHRPHGAGDHRQAVQRRGAAGAPGAAERARARGRGGDTRAGAGGCRPVRLGGGVRPGARIGRRDQSGLATAPSRAPTWRAPPLPHG